MGLVYRWRAGLEPSFVTEFAIAWPRRFLATVPEDIWGYGDPISLLIQQAIGLPLEALCAVNSENRLNRIHDL